MIDFELIDVPIGVHESAWVIPDEINTTCSLGEASRILVVPVWVTGVITTEIDIHDDMLIRKIFVEVAAGGKFGQGDSPKLRVRGASSDIGRYGVSREIPYGDTITIPLCGIHSTTKAVETSSICCWAGRIN